MIKDHFPSVLSLDFWKFCLLILFQIRFWLLAAVKHPVVFLIKVQVLVQLFQENSRQSNCSLVSKSLPCILVGYLIFPVAERLLVAEI